MTECNKRVLIICSMDAFANGERAKKVGTFLEAHGCDVELRTTTALTRMGTGKYTRVLPRHTPLGVMAFLFEILFFLTYGKKGRCVKGVVAIALKWRILLRGAVLARELRGKHYDLLICESNFDEALFLHDRIADIQILDLPAPQAEEMFFGGCVTKSGLSKLRDLENRVYAKADRLSFHWNTYIEFVKANKYNGKNFFELGYGAPAPTRGKRARFAKDPRIVFFGYLEGYWVNLPLLEKLCESCPGIDIYGGPRPSGPLTKYYKGYAPDKDVLANYQFGLITITDDELRRHSFSSKHLDYIAYGLPVLTPEWRYDSKLEASSIYFTPQNFLAQIQKFSQKEAWEQKSTAALKIAEELSWERVLQPLLT